MLMHCTNQLIKVLYWNISSDKMYREGRTLCSESGVAAADLAVTTDFYPNL